MATRAASASGAHDLQQCLHKLPTSCQLTSLPTCCACGDKRPHNSSYSRYIDGIGFCLGGRRQERYCPNCQSTLLRRPWKEGFVLTQDGILGFWDARVAVSDTPNRECQIPYVPDQTDFIKQWFDWHRGYAIIIKPDGTEERRELTGEALSEVPLGHLPRALEGLQAPPTSSRHQRHRARRRVPAASLHRESSNISTNGDLPHPPNLSIHENATRTSMTTSPPLVNQYIDPEDRIFDSSSTSTSPSVSDTEDYEEDPIYTREELLLDLQRNLDDVRANVLELSQRTPHTRTVSQVSSVTNQINAITRRLTSIRRQNSSSRGHGNPSQAMDGSPGNADHHLVLPSGAEPDAGTRNGSNIALYSDEELRQHIDRLESEANATILGPGDLSNLSQTSISNLNRITNQRLQAEEERLRRLRNPRRYHAAQETERRLANRSLPLAFSPHHPHTMQETQDYINNYDLARESQLVHPSLVSLPRHLRPGRSGQESGEASGYDQYGLPTNPDSPYYVPPYYWTNPTAPSPNPQSTSHRTTRLVRRPPMEQGSDTSPSNRHLFPRDRSGPLTTSQDSTSMSRSDGLGDERLPSSPGPHASMVYTRPSGAPRPLLGVPITPQMLQSMTDVSAIHQQPGTNQELRVWRSRVDPGRVARRQAVQPLPSLDNDSTRPEALAEEALMVKLECKICFSQISNHAVLPCGELMLYCFVTISTSF